MRRAAAWAAWVVLSACGRTGLDDPWGDGGPSVVDAGAGRADASTPDGGEASDAGRCPPLAHPPPAGLSASPRADPVLELLVLHADSTLQLVDDVTYARAAREKAAFSRLGAGELRFSPTWTPDLLLEFDDAGAAAVLAGTYRDWDCVNQAWRARPHVLVMAPPGSRRFPMLVEPVVEPTELALEYATLPHVLNVEHGRQIGTCASCGCSQDACLTFEPAGRWRWLWHTESGTCERRWYRGTTEVDGGVALETWADAGVPIAWLDATPRCWDELIGALRFPRDGGPP